MRRNGIGTAEPTALEIDVADFCARIQAWTEEYEKRHPHPTFPTMTQSAKSPAPASGNGSGNANANGNGSANGTGTSKTTKPSRPPPPAPTQEQLAAMKLYGEVHGRGLLAEVEKQARERGWNGKERKGEEKIQRFERELKELRENLKTAEKESVRELEREIREEEEGRMQV